MRKEKQLLLDQIKDQIDASGAMVFTSYEKLSPDLSDSLRSKIAETGGTFTVVRKRVLVKAAAEVGVTLDEAALKGHIGVLFAKDDPVNTTKALFNFVKDDKENFTILAGQFEGKLCSAEDLKIISELPSQDEMRAIFLGLLEAPMAQTLSVMEALMTSIMHCLENKSSQ